jgi:predicted Zn-dependent protease
MIEAVPMSTSRRLFKSLCCLAGVFLFIALAGCAQNPVTGESDFVMLSEDSEISIGRTNHPKIIAQYGRYDDEALQRYVQSVGDSLARVSHRKGLIYRFTVLDSPVINAFALPGGYIYITRGLMAYLNSEAELAAVLGHEIGHVTARHGVRQQSAAQAANIGYTIGSILFPQVRGPGSQDLFNILGGTLLSGYGREHELESDGLGAEYLARSGYDPKAMLDVISVLKNQSSFAEAQAKQQGRETQGYHGIFASHPDNDTRLQNMISAANQYRVQDGQTKRDDYLNRINGMTFGDSEKQGIRSGQHFYHLAMGFAVKFPKDWQINNKPESIQSIAAGGKAFIEMGAEDLNRRLSPFQFIQQRLGIDKLKKGQALTVNGLEGYTGIVEVEGNLGRVSVIYLGDKAFVFLAGVKDKRLFNQFDSLFLTTTKSLHRLQDKEIPLAKAQKIAVKTVGKGDSYQTWSSRSRISNAPVMQLRLLNAHYPAGELRLGQRAKSVQ